MASTLRPPTRTTGLTRAERDLIAQERPGDRHELIDGELFVTASPVPLHEFVSANFVFALQLVVRPARLGWVFHAPVDVRFTDGTIVVPDVGFVRRDRLGIVGPTLIDGAPDLLAEVVSPSTRGRDVGAKKALYARFGVPEYWLFDPVARLVTPFVLTAGRYRGEPRGSGTVTSSVVPGFAAEVADLFAMP